MFCDFSHSLAVRILSCDLSEIKKNWSRVYEKE